MLFNTVIFKNLIENVEIRYYCKDWVVTCDFIRQTAAEMEAGNWIEGEDFTIEHGEDVEIDDTDGLKHIRGGVYTDAE